VQRAVFMGMLFTQAAASPAEQECLPGAGCRQGAGRVRHRWLPRDGSPPAGHRRCFGQRSDPTLLPVSPSLLLFRRRVSSAASSVCDGCAATLSPSFCFLYSVFLHSYLLLLSSTGFFPHSPFLVTFRCSGLSVKILPLHGTASEAPRRDPRR